MTNQRGGKNPQMSDQAHTNANTTVRTDATIRTDAAVDPAKPSRRLIVFSGPTAVGKGTVEHKLLHDHPGIWVSVSATTRGKRPGEVDGVDYHFVTEDEFERMERDGEFLETAVVHGMAHYGTPIKPLFDHMNAGIPTLVEIDLQGARRVRQRATELGMDVMYVFLAPPTFADLAKRLESRGTENAQQREKRLETARVEIAAESEFDRVIINDEVDRAADELWGIIAEEYGLEH